MQVTLSTRPLGLEMQTGVTCQYEVLPRKRTGRGKSLVSKSREESTLNETSEAEDSTLVREDAEPRQTKRKETSQTLPVKKRRKG